MKTQQQKIPKMKHTEKSILKYEKQISEAWDNIIDHVIRLSKERDGELEKAFEDKMAKNCSVEEN